MSAWECKVFSEFAAMGASSSKPHTVEMTNTTPFQISRDVAARIEKATKLNETTDTERLTTAPAPIVSTMTHNLGSGQHYCERCNRPPTTTIHPNPKISSSKATGSDTCVASSYSRSSPDLAAVPSAPSCASKSSQMIVPVAVVPWQKRSIEIEEMQFDKTLDRVNKLFGEPVKWARECSGDITDMEKRLTVCYRDFPDEPLQCAKLAKQYHSFVFTKQFDEMTKSESGDKDNKFKETTSEPGPGGRK